MEEALKIKVYVLINRTIQKKKTRNQQNKIRKEVIWTLSNFLEKSVVYLSDMST